jgi:uncharacterized protein
MDSATEARVGFPLEDTLRTEVRHVAGPTPFETFVQPARAYPALWRVLLGCFLIAAGWVATLLLLPVAVTLLETWIPREAAITLVALYLFSGLLLGTGLTVRFLHRRQLASLFGPHGFRPGRCFLTALCLFGLSSVGGMWLLTVYPVTDGLSPRLWLALLPVAFLGVFIQSSAEEIVFRGYLLQALAARFRPRAVWLGVPASLFGALHWDTATHGQNAWLVALSAGLTGLILGDVTARYGDLSPAIGLHFANNVMALLILAPESPLSGLSLFVLGIDTADLTGTRWLLLADIALTLLAYGLWLAFWGRRRRLHSPQAGPI